MRLIKKDSTDVVLYFNILDSTAFTPETGITVTDLDMQYTRSLTAPTAKVDAIVSDADLTTHVDDKIVEVDATDQPGLYMACFPDAAFATGASGVVLTVSGTGFRPEHIEIQLVSFNPEDPVRLGLTALPNNAADTAGGLPVSDAGGLDLDAKLANTNEITVARMEALTDWINGGRLDLLLDLVLADTGELQTDWADGGRLDLLLDIVVAVINAVSRAANTEIEGTVDTVVNAHTPTTTEFQADDITAATTDQYKGRIVTFAKDTATAALQGQQTDITGYSLVGGIGQFTVTALTTAPANNDTFVIT